MVKQQSGCTRNRRIPIHFVQSCRSSDNLIADYNSLREKAHKLFKEKTSGRNRTGFGTERSKRKRRNSYYGRVDNSGSNSRSYLVIRKTRKHIYYNHVDNHHLARCIGFFGRLHKSIQKKQGRIERQAENRGSGNSGNSRR